MIVQDCGKYRIGTDTALSDRQIKQLKAGFDAGGLQPPFKRAFRQVPDWEAEAVMLL